MQPYQFLKELCRGEVQNFIANNEDIDLHSFILSKPKFKDIPNAIIAGQIKARLKAKSKFPEWYACNEIIYPASISIEQSSSQKTAEWKSQHYSGNFCLDLTGGMGVDSYYLSHFFSEISYVENNEGLFKITCHNHQALKAKNILHYHSSAEDFIQQSSENFDLIYADPSRRSSKRRVFSLEHYEPNLIPHLGFIHSRTKRVLIKTSPFLDITDAMNKLEIVSRIIILVVENECKELLFELTVDGGGSKVEIFNLDSDEPNFSFNLKKESEIEIEFSTPLKYMYEPNPGVLKAGGFKSVALDFGVKKLAVNSHLYTSEQLQDFPGRRFELVDVLPVDAKVVSEKLSGNKANLSIRNFPGSVDELKKKLKIKDGGEDYLFATTLTNGDKKLLLCRKIIKQNER